MALLMHKMVTRYNQKKKKKETEKKALMYFNGFQEIYLLTHTHTKNIAFFFSLEKLD